MTTTPEELFACFDALGIVYETRTHAPAFTVEQGEAIWGDIPGIHCKNLFLKDAKARLWLVVAPHNRIVNLKALPGLIGAARLSFGQPPLLRETLGVEPGSVTPFSLINDRDGKKVRVVLDAWMMTQPLVCYHPLVNTATTIISSMDLLRFISHCGHDYQIVDLEPESEKF